MKAKGDLKDRAAQLLADVEVELRHADRADDVIGGHAEEAEGRLMAELEKRHADLEPDADAVRVFRLAQLRQARQVSALARRERVRRGA